MKNEIGLGAIKGIYSGIFALTLFIQFELVLALFSSSWDINTLYFVIPFLTLLIGCILLWMNKKIGLFFAAAYSSYVGSALFAAGISRIVLSVRSEEITNSTLTYMLFPTDNQIVQLLIGALFLILAWIVSKRAYLGLPNPNKDLYERVLGGGGVIALLLTFN